MMLRLCFSLILLSAGCLQAQDYQLWYTGQEKIFSNQAENPESGFRGARVESFEVMGIDTLMTLTRAIQTYNPDAFDLCFVPGRYGWAGDDILIRPTTGEHWITNMYGDSIYLKVKEPLGALWPAIEGSAFGDIYAEVVNLVDSTFLGIQDSVKTIRLFIYDSQTEEYGYEYGTIDISQNHGLLSTIGFTAMNADYWNEGINMVDYFGQESFYDQTGFGFSNQYYLAGSSDFESGIRNLDYDDIYDFHPGDTLHVVDQYPGGGTIEAREILERIESDGIINYVVDGATIYYNGNYTNPEIISYSQYENQTMNQDLLAWLYSTVDMQALPGTMANPNLDLGGATVTGMHINAQGRRVKTTLDGSSTYFLSDNDLNTDDTCSYWAGGGGTCSTVSEVYSIEGLGGPYMYCDNFTVELVHYVKNGESVGEPIQWRDLILSTENSRRPEIKVFPNPASNYIQLETSSKVNLFRLAAMTGEIIVEFSGSQLTDKIDLSKIPAGIYVYSIFFKNSLSLRGRLILTGD